MSTPAAEDVPIPDQGADALRASLMAEARRRFGDARAAALEAELGALAEALARVAATPLPDELEP